ncbi:unnamed protein product [Cylicocyclus nassatus]|uniref:Uncharacterized protein n=1 Tax=Cylicocyclus nassatus TaxID=53992 RepID=A0AA36H777_CYLNA|nr:unnamed protein product [Cylicocyclus nassatus]
MRHIYNPIIGDRYEKSLVSRQVAIVYRRSLSQETSLGPLCRRGFGSDKDFVYARKKNTAVASGAATVQRFAAAQAS